MKVAGIVAEYNPFHNGHAYHVQKVRDFGCSHVVAVMSGDYVQRGSPAIADMFIRAKAAVVGGVDLVILLPLPWSVGAAHDFSKGAVDVLKATGVIDVLSFGCEAVDIKFKDYVKDYEDEDLQNCVRLLLSKGIAYPKAIAEACKLQGREALGLFLSEPNNLLAFEYYRQLQGDNIDILPVVRNGVKHDSTGVADGFASASYIRRCVYEKYNENKELYPLYKMMPKQSADVLLNAFLHESLPIDLHSFDIASLSRLRLLNVDDYINAPYVNDGFERRLFSAVQNALSFEHACELAKSKNVSYARVRRTLLSSALQIRQSHLSQSVPFLRILAMNAKGMQVLREMKEKSSLPVILKHSDSKNLDKHAKEIYDLNMNAHDLYSLCKPKTTPCGAMANSQIFILNN